MTDFSFVSSKVGIPFATNVGALTVTRCESATRYVVLYTKTILYMLCEWMFQPTAAISVSKQTMPVDGASTIKCAVVLQLPALVKQTGFRLVCGMTLVSSCVLYT